MTEDYVDLTREDLIRELDVAYAEIAKQRAVLDGVLWQMPRIKSTIHEMTCLIEQTRSLYLQLRQLKKGRKALALALQEFSALMVRNDGWGVKDNGWTVR